MQVRLMRRLREKHHITTCQFARYSCVSRQRLMQIELGDSRPTAHTENLVQSAFEQVIAERRRELAALESDYRQYCGRLLDYAREENNMP